ncbi:MAG: alanine racemase [Clostridia bacterium]|nr:alanine racemase [Clostridia bacterium]
MPDASFRPVWAEVDLKTIVHNLGEIRRLIGPAVKIMAVVKANAYGHGLDEVARTVAAAGAEWLAVAVPEEAFRLRELGLNLPVLVLGHTPPRVMAEAIRREVSLTLYSPRQVPDLVRAAREAGRRVKVHVKVDTGMGRLGFSWENRGVQEIIEALSHPELEPEGIFTHFACADEPDPSFTLEQHGRFREVLRELEKGGLRFAFRHAANSAATLLFPQTHLDLVRPGLALYGLYPGEGGRRLPVRLVPAMSFKARIVFLKEVPGGTPLSYGRTFVTSRPSRIATLPVGYADGYGRLLSNRAEVLVRGRRAPVVGRVCMDHILVDVTDVPEAAEGDEAVLFGRQGETSLPVEELAEKMGTISYEVLCQVGPRVPRLYRT